MYKVSTSKLISIAIYVLLIIIYSCLPINNLSLESICRISVIFVVISFLILFYKSKKITGGILFEICLLVMHFGQIIIIAFNMKFPQVLKTSIAIGNNILYSVETVHITTLSILISSFIVAVFEKKETKKTNDDSNYKLSSFSWIIIGIIISLTLLSDITRIINVSNFGYIKGYHQNNIILYYGDLLFPLAYFFLISTYKNNYDVLKKIFLFVIIREISCALFIGSRGEAVLDIIMCVFAILKLSTSVLIKKKVMNLFIITCLAGVVLLPFTGLLRGNEQFDFNSINPITYNLTEFGGSIVNVRYSYTFLRQIPTSSFFESFLTILPFSTSLFPNLIYSYGNSYAEYLNKFVGGGLGGSLIGEGVFWFGESIGVYIYVGIFTLILVFAMNKLNNNKMEFNERNIVILYLIFHMFYQIRGSVSSFQTGIKILIYFLIILKLFRPYLYHNDGGKKYERRIK